MNIRDLKSMHERTGLEELVIHGVDPLLHFSDLLREDLEEDWTHGDTVTERRLFFCRRNDPALKGYEGLLTTV